MPPKQRLDRWSKITLVVTVSLFTFAVSTHGFTHDLLLEVAVFLVSVKLVINGSKLDLAQETVTARLDAIQQALERVEAQSKR